MQLFVIGNIFSSIGSQGEDFDRKRNLDVSAEDAAKWERRKRKHHNPDPGFSNFEAATAR